MRDLYNDDDLQHKAWEFANRYFKQELLDLLTGHDADGKFVGYQNITCLLDQCENLGEFTSEEWKLFFENVREQGI
jgi:hypothetical protein